MSKKPNELKKQSNNFFYCYDNQIKYDDNQEMLNNFFNTEINAKDDNDIDDDEIINFCDCKQNNHFNVEINNNSLNTITFQSLEQKSKNIETSNLDIGFPFNFKTKSINYNISEEVLYNTGKTTMKTNMFVTTTIGKKTYRDDETFGDNKKERRKFDDDNIIRKIKISYIDFIIAIINIIVNTILKNNNVKYRYKFYDLSHKYKNQANKEAINLFRTQTIEDIIKEKISSQYLTKNENSNKETCQKIKNDEKLKDIYKILSKNILFFFDKIYIKNRKKKYNLNEFGLFDLEFILPDKVQLYEDLLSKNKNEKKYNTYKSKMNLCCKNFFIPGNDNPYFKTRKSK